MHTVITQYDRPSVDIPYFIDSDPIFKDEFGAFIDHCFMYVWPDTTMSNIDESELRRITTVTYADQDTLIQFLSWLEWAFPTFFADRDAYCAANNITITRTEQSS